MNPSRFSKTTLVLIILAGAICMLGTWLFLRSGISNNKPPSVVLISIDTCRADHLGCYGYHRQTTPNIDKIAQESILFTNAYSPVPITLPAHSSMLTGVIPPSHGVHDNGDYILGRSNITLAETLRENDFRTGAVVSSFILDSQFGLEQGFDDYNDHFERPITLDKNERRGEDANRVAFEWLARHKEERFFLLLHYYDPHFKYDPPEPFASRFADDLYAGEIAYADYCVGRVLEKLKDMGLYDSTLIIIAADHGEMLGEHGEQTHAYFIYQSAIKVPLIFKLPGRRKAVKVDDPVSLIDIVPTVCSVLGIAPSPRVQGRDLSPYFGGRQPTVKGRHIYCESLLATKYEANSLLGVVADRWKYIQTTRPELYDLTEDPGETLNLAAKQPHRVRILQDHLRQILESAVQNDTSDSKAELNEEDRKRLESLGYIVGASVKEDFEFDQTKDDPKDVIDFHLTSANLPYLEDQKKYDQARIICEKLIAQRPQCYNVHYAMGSIALEQNDLAAAIVHLKEALKINPRKLDAHGKLGRVLFIQGKIGEAIESLNTALELKPDWPEILNNLAWIKSTNENPLYRKPEEAVELALRACELTGYEKPDILNTLATAYAAAGNFPEAVKFAEKTLSMVRTQGQTELIPKAQESLDMFKAGKSYGEGR